MENEVKKKGDDGELASILIVLGGIFTVTLLGVDIFYGNMSALLHSWVMWPFAVFHVVALILWIIVLKFKDEPNLEWTRWALAFSLLTCIIIVMAHRSGWLSKKMFDEEVNKNKQEQNAN
jgi:hypothetical protein